jgi:hypothetical protein
MPFMPSKVLFVFVFLFFNSKIFAEKLLILTSAYNRPDFVEIQYKTFKKFLLDDYEYVVFNDAKEPVLQHAIENICAKWGIHCINIPQSIHDLPYLERLPEEEFHSPTVRNANVVQYALNSIGFSHNGIVIIIDSDMFLVKPFSIEDYLADYEIAGVQQSYSHNGTVVEYLWIGIAFLDMAKLPKKNEINFNCGRIEGVPVDAGGYTYYYLQSHPELKLRPFGSLHSDNIPSHCDAKDVELEDKQLAFVRAGLLNVEFLLNGTFFHYRGGTNWDNQTRAYHEKKTSLFNEYIKNILD